jgi:hypothetical protein
MRPLNSLVGLASSPAATFNHPFRRKLMKHLRQLCATAVLTFALAFSSFAGTIDCGVVSPPPPPNPASITGDMATGITAADGTSAPKTAFVDPATDFTLNILQSVLSLF